LVNASPVGMAPQGEACSWPEELIRQTDYVVDSVAIPVQTRLIQTASRLGKSTVSGFEIIGYQRNPAGLVIPRSAFLPIPADWNLAD
jgi:shikimate 5-dehydrogenase